LQNPKLLTVRSEWKTENRSQNEEPVFYADTPIRRYDPPIFLNPLDNLTFSI
jgi:hypothetical protein